MSHAYPPNTVVSSRVENIKKRFEAANTTSSTSVSPNASPFNSPEKLLLASVNNKTNKSPTYLTSRTSVPKKVSSLSPNPLIANKPALQTEFIRKRNGVSPVRSTLKTDKQLNGSSPRGNNIRRSPAFRCDKMVKGRNVVGQRPKSFVDTPSQMYREDSVKTNIKRLHSSPGKSSESIGRISESPDRLKETVISDELSSIYAQRPVGKISNPMKPEILSQKPKTYISPVPRLRSEEANSSTNVQYAVVSKPARNPKNVQEMKKLFSNNDRPNTKTDFPPKRNSTNEVKNRLEFNPTDLSLHGSETKAQRLGLVWSDGKEFTKNLGNVMESEDEVRELSNSKLVITKSLKKALSSPLPAGPPPRKPPRTFEHMAPAVSVSRNAVSNKVQILNQIRNTNNDTSAIVTKVNDLQNGVDKRMPKVSPKYGGMSVGTGRSDRSPEKNIQVANAMRNNTSPSRSVANSEVQIQNNVFMRRDEIDVNSKKLTNDSAISPRNIDKSTMRLSRSKTESEIMLKKLENVLLHHQSGGIILKQKSPTQRPMLDKSTGLYGDNVNTSGLNLSGLRPLPNVPKGLDVSHLDSQNVLGLGECLKSFNCVGADPSYTRGSHFYEKLNEKNSEFFVDITSNYDPTIVEATNKLCGGLRKSSSVEHIYAVPFEFLNKIPENKTAFSFESKPNFFAEKIVAVTDDKVVEIGHFKGFEKHSENDIDRETATSITNAANRQEGGLHYLCTSLTSDPVVQDPTVDVASVEPTENVIARERLGSEPENTTGSPVAPRKKPSFLRLAGLARPTQSSSDPKLHRAKIQMIMNQAFGTPLQGLPTLPPDGSDSESASSPEEKSLQTIAAGFSPQEEAKTSLDSQGGSSDDPSAGANEPGPDLTQLTERRKKYVRRVSCRVPTVRQPDAFPHLFHYVLLVGLNLGCGVNKPYVKHKYPPDAEVTPHIEEFCFPDASDWPRPHSSWTNGKPDGQSYSLVITNDKGERTFGYCRRVIPEGTDMVLPLAYCIISPFRATGFYYKVLSELESRHGQPEVQQTAFIMDLYNCQLPGPGQSLKPSAPAAPLTSPVAATLATTLDSAASVLASNVHDKGVSVQPRRGTLSHSATIVRRPLDLRLEERDLTQLFTSLSVSVLIQVFSSLLLERKVLLFSSSLSKLSSCVEGLQSILYPFSWQHTFIPVLPASQVEYCDAPTPYIFGLLKTKDGQVPDVTIADGIVVDLDTSKVLFSIGDECSILPSRLRRSLKTALQMVGTMTQPGDAARNVLISEAFVRLFVEVCGHYQTHIVTQQDGMRVFERDSFVKSVESRSTQLFLEWFTETSMWHQFVTARMERGARYRGVFEQRAAEHTEEMDKNTLLFLRNYKAVNKKFKNIGDRFKDWTPFA